MSLLNKIVNKNTLALAVTIGLMSATCVVTASTVNTSNAPLTTLKATQALNFSFPLAAEVQLALNSSNVESHSNEYWVSVTGNELNQGFAIHTSTPDALIKVSRTNNNSQALSTEQLNLHSTAKPEVNLARHIASEDDLNATGVFANSSAIKLDRTTAPGTYTLRYNAPLAANDKFVVHVKEKHSSNKLILSTSKQHYLQGEALTFDALMMAADDTLGLSSINAFIVAPSGKKTTVTTKHLKNGISQILATDFARDHQAIEAPINGLYELHVNTIAKVNGQAIHRTGKIAFALAAKTARLDKVDAMAINAHKPQANIALNVMEPGRFEVRGILYGHDSKGQLKPIMETHSAQNLTVGEQAITMKFDQKLLKQTGLSAPYQVKHIRLYDQTRMSRL